MNFNDMHALAKQIDSQVKSLETKVAHPMSMMYSNNSSQGVKVLSMLKNMIKDVENKKVFKNYLFIYIYQLSLCIILYYIFYNNSKP